MSIQVAEEYWTVSLAEIAFDRLDALLVRYREQLKLEFTMRAEAGLDLIELEDSVLGENYYLGEASVAQCQLEVTCLDSGQTTIGFCKVMKDSSAYAEAIALSDALLRMDRRYPELEALVEEGDCLRQKRLQERQRILQQTQINFSRL